MWVPCGVASFGPVGTESRQTATRTGAAADTIAAQFLAGSCRRPGGGGLLSNFTSSVTVGALRVPSGVASFPGTRSGRDRVVRQTATRTGAAADTIAAQFLAGSCRRPGGGGLLSNFKTVGAPLVGALRHRSPPSRRATPRPSRVVGHSNAVGRRWTIPAQFLAGSSVGDFFETSNPHRRGTPCGCPAGSRSPVSRAPPPFGAPEGRRSQSALESRRPPARFLAESCRGPAVGDFVDRQRRNTRSGRDRVVRQTATRTGAAADTIPAQFLVGSCRRPGGGGLLRKTSGTPEGGHSCPPLRRGCLRWAPAGPELGG